MPTERPSRRRFGAAALAALAALPVLAGTARAERINEIPPAAPLPQIKLAVAEIQIVPAYAPPPGASTETLVPFAPKTALEAWAKTHVEAVGRRWVAAIVIRNASLTSQPVKARTANWRDWFRRQPVERYGAVLELELQIRDDAGQIRAQAFARANHARFLMDDSRDPERERVIQLQRLTDEVIAAALNRLDAELRATLPQWVR